MVQLTNSDAPNIDGGQYKLLIGPSEMRSVRDFEDPEKLVDKVEIRFTIVGGDWDGSEFTDLFSLTTGKKSKLGQLARAAFKTDDLPSEWDTDDLEGKHVIATIKLKDTGYNSIVPDTILKIQSKTKPSAKPQPQAELDDDDTWNEDTDAA
jgi:hypothetical protein